MENSNWMNDARCKGMDTELFFPFEHESNRPAKEVCESCDVREKCLNYALDHNITYGVWGGKSERERRPLRKKRISDIRSMRSDN